MKFKLLALAVPALLAANVANADIEFWNQDGNVVSMYGRVTAENIISKQGNGNGDNSSGRIGFFGVSQLTDSLAGYGRAEFQTNANDDSHEVRYAYAGFDYGSLGTLDYGKNDGVTKMITSYTDVLPEFGGDSNDMSLLGQREKSVVTYRNQGFYGLVDGLNIALQYADKSGSADGKDKLEGNKSRFGAAVEYAILNSGFTIGGTYAVSSKEDNGTAAPEGNESYRAQSWVAAGKFEQGNLYVAMLFNYSKNVKAGVQVDDNGNGSFNEKGVITKSIKGYEMVVAYGVDLEVGKVTPSIAYIQDKAKHYGTEDSQYLAKYVNLGLQYDFNKNFSAFVDYKINRLSESDVGNDVYTKDSVALGLVYQF